MKQGFTNAVSTPDASSVCETKHFTNDSENISMLGSRYDKHHGFWDEVQK